MYVSFWPAIADCFVAGLGLGYSTEFICVVDIVALITMFIVCEKKLAAYAGIYMQTRLLSFLVPTVLENTPRGERAFDIYSRCVFTCGKSKIENPELQQTKYSQMK